MKEMVGGCCVCSDDRGWSENPLVYCDGQSCAVAVHQACYGIVTVPSGPWFCRKCESQERSARVRCELCPSRDGALKRTDNQGWAHVVCALYIPEVRFGNVTTMEPIILQLIPQERYNKTCYICQEMGKGSRSTAGACMQCNKSGCKQQFHVTCAQQLGLLCEEAGNYLDNVKYCGYCQHHYSKLKKGGNVKTIPPYKPISHETNSSDGPSSPEKELEPPAGQQHTSASAMLGSGNTSSNMKSNNRLSIDQNATTSASSSSKQRKSSSVSKGVPSSTATSSTPTFVSTGSSSAVISSQSSSSASVSLSGLSGTGSTGSNSTTGGNNSKTVSSSSNSGSNKDKDKYSKNVNKVSSTNKSHDKDLSSGSSSASSSSQRDKGSKSKSSSGINTVNSSTAGGVGPSVNLPGANAGISSSLSKDDSISLSSSISATANLPSSSIKSHDNSVIKPDKTLAQISSAAASSARAASLSPAAIPTTLIIKPPHEHSGNNKDLLSKEAIAKFTTSNFTETIVVNSDSVFGSTGTNSGSNSNNTVSSGAVTNTTSTGSNIGSSLGSTTVIETVSGSGGGGGGGSGSNTSKLPVGNSYSTAASNVAKKRKADARSTPTSFSSGDIDITRDMIKDVAVSLVPLPLNKSDSIDPASILSIEKSIKKAKTEPNSPHPPTGELNLQNVSPNLIQTHGSNVIASSIKNQQQPNSPQLQQQQQQQQQQGQQHTPSLVVSVPLSTATVPGINLLTSNSSASSTTSNAPSSSVSSNTPNIISPSQMSSASSLYQQLTQRTGEQIMNATSNRSSPIIQHQSNVPSHVIQNPTHSILERHSPSMRSSPAIITSAGSQQQIQHPFSSGGMDLNLAGMSSNVSVLQSVSPVSMSAIQSTSSSPIIPGGGGGDGGLKITYEKQTTNVRIAALQEEKSSGRRSRTPDNSFGSNPFSSGSSGGLKFSYEAQPSNPAAIGAMATIITPQAMVKESPPSSPGSDSGMIRSNKRNRKLSTNSNVGILQDTKDSKLFQNGVVHATHMLGNQLNPNSSVAQKMSDQLNMEMETHTFIETAPQIVGPPFPGKIQASRTSNPAAPPTGGPSLTSMLSGSGTATANGNTPQSLEQLLERQWEQGSQFLMEQAQHFDIASLLSCLHQLRSENIRLEDHVNNLVARRDHLLAVNARLAIPLNPTAIGGVGLAGGGSGGAGGPGGTGGGSGTGSTGSQGHFNNMHGNGPHESGGGSTNANTATISSRSSRIQQHQTQQQHQQQSQSHFGSNVNNQIPLENGIDFRHSSSSHQSTNNSSIRHHSPTNQHFPASSGSSNRQSASTSNSGSEQPVSHARSGRSNSSSTNTTAGSSNNSTTSSSSYQQTIYNTAHQIPLLLEHHQQEHHTQQPLQQQPQPSQAHHHRQVSPTVSSRSHHSSHSVRTSGTAASASHSHHPPLSHHHQSLSTVASSAHSLSSQQQQQQQPPPQRQRH
ncbi:protein AF-10 isoform X4 [Malaya genurostris]|uniref:protein AF-10 isoform X4 n=1 Tax=Malaya genurostris TaxID=325434 RepID=UPI0026F39E4B|nr:protein AF-10 isoform X4 [Malaya genurostris]